MRDLNNKDYKWSPGINPEWVDKLKQIKEILGDKRLGEAIVELGRQRIMALKTTAEIMVEQKKNQQEIHKSNNK